MTSLGAAQRCSRVLPAGAGGFVLPARAGNQHEASGQDRLVAGAGGSVDMPSHRPFWGPREALRMLVGPHGTMN